MSFFKAYDMRGTFGKDFDLDTVHSVGFNLPKVLNAKRVLVGRDVRVTSADIRNALVEGLLCAGADVVDIGIATTPMVYFFTAEDGYDASVQITASHNPPSDNGLKVSKKGALPVGAESGLKELERLVKENPFVGGLEKTGTYSEEIGVKSRFVEWLKKRIRGIENLRFAVDTSNGSAGILARDLFGNDAIYLNEELDGTFPNHSPNPLKESAREQLAKKVVEEKLDCGLIFDGDADRVMVVDENGSFIQPDYLIPCVAEMSADDKYQTVIYDVRTSRAVVEALKGMSFNPIMGKVGHANAKVLLRESSAICGGELAGHYYFKEFKNCDSGEFAAIKILEAFAKAKSRGMSVSQYMAPLISKYANSGEMNFTVEDKDSAIKRVLDCALGLSRMKSRSDIDGSRLEFEEGWLSVRKSYTEPYLRLLIECDTKERLENWKNALVGALEGK